MKRSTFEVQQEILFGVNGVWQWLGLIGEIGVGTQVRKSLAS